jgi:hypothetical protein
VQWISLEARNLCLKLTFPLGFVGARPRNTIAKCAAVCLLPRHSERDSRKRAPRRKGVVRDRRRYEVLLNFGSALTHVKVRAALQASAYMTLLV